MTEPSIHGVGTPNALAMHVGSLGTSTHALGVLALNLAHAVALLSESLAEPTEPTEPAGPEGIRAHLIGAGALIRDATQLLDDASGTLQHAVQLADPEWSAFLSRMAATRLRDAARRRTGHAEHTEHAGHDHGDASAQR